VVVGVGVIDAALDTATPPDPVDLSLEIEVAGDVIRECVFVFMVVISGLVF
jgi:hypothetical protein